MKIILTFLLLTIFIDTAAGQPDDKIAKTPKLNYDWRPGFVSITELTGAFGLSETSVPYSEYYYGITTVAGYQFTRNIKAGIGAGIHIHNQGTLIPVYIDARYSFSAQEVVPFIAAAGGMSLKLNDTEDNNFNPYIFINPSLGIKRVAANRTGVSFSIGVFTMSSTGSRSSFVNFKLGLELKSKYVVRQHDKFSTN